jgi:hypothetical protein
MQEIRTEWLTHEHLVYAAADVLVENINVINYN